MTADKTPHPVRDPAPGPAVILSLPALWEAVTNRMNREGMVHQTTFLRKKAGAPDLKALCDVTGLDRSSVSNLARKAAAGHTITSQRGGLSVNADLTLTTWAQGSVAAYGTVVRDMSHRRDTDPEN